jgi:putative ABC transport system permease protein
LLYVRDELSYDRYHQNARRIYRVVVDEINEGKVRQLANTCAPMTPALKATFSEIEHVVRLFPNSMTVARSQDERFQEKRFFFADSTVFEVFSFPFCGTLLIALITVSTQAIKAALANPVESLRHE